jgi:aminopeptidase N
MVQRALPLERDEQLAGTLIGRLVTAVTRYADPSAAPALVEAVEALLHAGAARDSSGYGMRKAHLDAYIGVARSPEAVRRLRDWLRADSAAGLPLRPPTRWAIVARLIARGAADADALIAEERRRDPSADGARQAFAVSAAKPDGQAKATLFTRWFADSALNEEWVTSSLRAFHDPEAAELTRPLLLPALDTLPWIQRNRRIFFLGSWLGATLGGQRDAAALSAVDGWLARHPDLATDLRQKVLQARDELERTVRIREQFTTPIP